MIQKRPLAPRRLRSQPPRGFGWLDHRLLRQGYLARCSPPGTGLYCLLVCAGDGSGLSFYSDPRICALLGLEPALLPRARRELVELGLVDYQKPLYQVLALSDAPVGAPNTPAIDATQANTQRPTSEFRSPRWRRKPGADTHQSEAAQYGVCCFQIHRPAIHLGREAQQEGEKQSAHAS